MPSDRSSDPHPRRNFMWGLAAIAVLVAFMVGLSHFGRDATRVTPGGAEVPTDHAPIGSTDGKAPPTAS